MSNDILLSIGELAKIGKVSHKTLRYYDQLGLLKPALVNQNNNYRFYKKSQITRLIAIKQLQELGISLEDISTFYNQNTPSNIFDHLSNLLATQEASIKNEIALLSDKLKKIQMMKSHYTDIIENLGSNDPETILIKEISDRTIIFKEYNGEYTSSIYRDTYKLILDRMQEQGLYFSNICSPPLAIRTISKNSQQVNLKIGYAIKSPLGFEDFQKITLPAGHYACVLHKGNYNSLRKIAFYETFSETLTNEIISPSATLEIYYISEVTTDITNIFLTEVQIFINNV
ncbi:MerR family transcriptional regulator [Acetobacterium paludosum]|uniref:MerR family transcriptional regulator n=1 Tax=Acetobacterium paludosum TaxID=52693 RepID=A0A923KUQ4_9FIRM|nr:MerR family transcriptional regulator [Acetobacterium paludosum]MBC3886730.1 MerR family transcriptional regulator [Acetobacterium paludosum]